MQLNGPDHRNVAVRRFAFIFLLAAVVCLPIMMALSSDDGPAAVVPVYLVSASGLLLWCLVFLRSEVLLVRWGLAGAIGSACFVWLFLHYLSPRAAGGVQPVTLDPASRGETDFDRTLPPSAGQWFGGRKPSNQAMQLTVSR